MRNRLTLFFLLPALPLLALQLQSQDQALKKAFPEATRFEPQAVTLSASERASLDQASGGKSLDASALRVSAFAGKKFLGSAWVDDEIGKHRPITYLVALDPGRKIISLQMIHYREAYGLEARSPRFTRQFVGKGEEAPLEVGKDLDAISGATLSCKALAFGARKALRQEARFPPFQASQGASPASLSSSSKE